MWRRVLAVIVLLALGMGPLRAAASQPTPETLPGTTLEAEARDDEGSPAPWLIGSGLAAAAVVVVGGSVLKRRMK